MSTTSRSILDAFDNPAAYRIRVLGKVAADLHDYFHGMSGETIVCPDGAPATAQSGRFGGWRVFFDQGCLSFVYNVLGIRHFPVEATTPIATGPAKASIPASGETPHLEFPISAGVEASAGSRPLCERNRPG